SEALAPDVAFLAVADGFGSFGRGSVADTVVMTIRDFFRRKVRSGALTTRGNLPLALRRLMLAAFAHTNNRIYAQSGSHDDYVAAGASLTAALVVGSQIYIGHVGESRAYLVREEKLSLLTEDDAITPEVGGGGKMTIGAGARLRSLLTRTLGTQPALEASVANFELGDDDRLILCTDGVHKTLSTDELEFAASSPGSSAEVVDRILALLKMRGNQDGGTVIVGRELTIPISFGAEISARRGVSGALSVAFVVMAVIVVIALLYEALVPLHIALH
ncbi:MAG: serine/threonine-protein phosphatase, partial [Candidatus Eremiobacteraeota bacterium]|nr:serine/threonine-protein phosphatase [Candidatus Eremiobacteraeota bacterium]